jgi:hypothetical protein
VSDELPCDVRTMRSQGGYAEAEERAKVREQRRYEISKLLVASWHAAAQRGAPNGVLASEVTAWAVQWADALLDALEKKP